MELTVIEKIFTTATAFCGLVGAIIGILGVRDEKRRNREEGMIDASNLSQENKLYLKKKLQHHRRAFIVAALVALVLASTILVGTVFAVRTTIWQRLAAHDPRLFTLTKDKTQCYLSRLFPGRDSLLGETVFADELLSAKDSFDLMAFNATTVLENYQDQILGAAKQGVQIRVLLGDYLPINGRDFDNFAASIGRNPEELRRQTERAAGILKNLKGKIEGDRRIYRGTLEYRWCSGPIPASLWIIDAERNNQLAHVGVYMGPQAESWPYWRISKDGGPFVPKLRAEFDRRWAQSRQ